MRRHLGSFLPVLLLTALSGTLLAGCGDDSSSPVAKDSSSAGDSPSAQPVGHKLVDTITVTGAGGTVSDTGVALSDDAAVQEFVSQFTSADLPQQVQDAVAATEVPEGEELYGAVVAVGCDSPDQVDVDVSDAAVTITAVAVPSPKPECFAAMTTVALVLVDR
jgi:hypothetical protein